MHQPQIIKLDKEKENKIRKGICAQNLMKLYNASSGAIGVGYAEVIIPSQEALIRGAGFFYGGVLAAAADTAAYFAAATTQDDDAYFVTVDLKINYLSPASGKELLTIGEVVKTGRTLTICRSDCFVFENDEKRLVATSLVTLMKIGK
ncbi:hypothetical protein AB670_00258 [Chryseobacterium sp. MOF25P]|uniref:PaaI family thioesterase n=1 Tax=unclassified Chryseobacterium TaxID=2593645 RepID=UPI0008049C36|nr:MULTISPECIES: PaaI family thioesterase [unclassified Chryseobacterium]OBW43341.1 hypothetical protein AB670_00258 [Chryseobacterium sp. MOF25P]OBW47001.1 hypothetical protein AB671_00877 [Chryseobacterium sp. BGARF1]